MKDNHMILEKYSMGVGDRFAHQGSSQLNAFLKAKAAGVNIAPVWNKSYREHSIIKTAPCDVRAEADQAVKALNWTGSYYVDADHINLNNVASFIECSDFFTLDVADFILKAPSADELAEFVDANSKYIGPVRIAGIEETFDVTGADIERIGGKFLLAIKEAGKIYRHLEKARGAENFVTEVSMDESDQPQTPLEMLFILAGLAGEGVPAQTIAPKFTGRFNKGVDYVGDVAAFDREFNQDLAVIRFAVREFSLPANLKLSVHSGSDKFSIYDSMNKALKKFDAGLHIKTAGTTWLEELIGLATAGGRGLEIAKEVYKNALSRFDELCKPYSTVIDIDRAKLPTDEAVDAADGKAYASALRHDQSCEDYNIHFRQLLHLSYKIAAEMGGRFSDALEEYEDIIAQNVTENIYDRHMTPIFMK